MAPAVNNTKRRSGGLNIVEWYVGIVEAEFRECKRVRNYRNQVSIEIKYGFWAEITANLIL